MNFGKLKNKQKKMGIHFIEYPIVTPVNKFNF